MESKRYEVKSDYENVDWAKVIPILMAFAYVLLKNQKISKSDIERMSYDFTMDTILEFLEEKEKFDSDRNPDLILYLKYNILRRKISNFSKSHGHTKVSSKSISDINMLSNYIEEMPIDENLDVTKIISGIQKDIDQDLIMSIIFEARYEENMKRGEICQEFSIDTATYDNAIKRLRRIVKNHLN